MSVAAARRFRAALCCAGVAGLIAVGLATAPAGAATPTPTPTPLRTSTSSPSGPGEVDECFSQQQNIAHDAQPGLACGKLTVTLVAVAGTYPAGVTPDLSGVQIDIVDTSQTDGTPATASCTTAADSADPSAACPESQGPTSGDGSQYGAQATWTPGDTYRLSVDPEPSLPPHTTIGVVTGAFPDCTGFPSSTPSGCSDTVVMHAVGQAGHIGLVVHNSATHHAVSGATYSLCSPTTAAPVTGGATCPVGSTVVATATTGGHGTLTFPGLFPASPNYTVVPGSVPSGYLLARSSRLTGFSGSASLSPKRPSLRNLFRVTPEDTAITINVLDRAVPESPPLTLTGLGTPANGSVTDPHAEATYTPNNGFLGLDYFTYTARNRLGGTATATITVKVTASGSTAAMTLPNTGAPVVDELGEASWAIAAGAFLVVIARRRRRVARYAGTARRPG